MVLSSCGFMGPRSEEVERGGYKKRVRSICDRTLLGGDGRTRTAVFYRSSPFNKVFIFNTLSLFEYNAIYLYISKSVCKFVCTF